MNNRFLRIASPSPVDYRKDFCAGSSRAMKHPFQPPAYKKGPGNYVRYRLWKSQKSQLERIEAQKRTQQPLALRSCLLCLQRDTSYDNGKSIPGAASPSGLLGSRAT